MAQNTGMYVVGVLPVPDPGDAELCTLVVC